MGRIRAIRSTASLARDELILDAALAEVAAVGVDRLGMSPVARRAGLTTGALYSRYENATEMSLAVWQQRVSGAHYKLLDCAVTSVLGTAEGHSLELAAALTEPSETDAAALGLLITCRRADDLEEVIAPDVVTWLERWSAMPGDEPVRRAWVLATIGLTWGALLHSVAGDPFDAWARLYERARGANHAKPLPDEPPVGAEFLAPTPDTGDPGRDALIEAAVSIIGRAGFERATVSRIARRAGFTSGGLFGRYKTKELLLADALAVTQEVVTNADTAAIAAGERVERAAEAANGVFLATLRDQRRSWLSFRLEAYLAARHYPVVQNLLHDRHRAVDGSYQRVREATTDDEVALAVMVSRAVQAVPLGLSLLAQFVPDLGTVDFRPAFNLL